MVIENVTYVLPVKKSFQFNVYRSAYLEATGQAGSVKHRIAKLAERTGGMYDVRHHMGLHRGAGQVVFTSVEEHPLNVLKKSLISSLRT